MPGGDGDASAAASVASRDDDRFSAVSGVSSLGASSRMLRGPRRGGPGSSRRFGGSHAGSVASSAVSASTAATASLPAPRLGPVGVKLETALWKRLAPIHVEVQQLVRIRGGKGGGRKGRARRAPSRQGSTRSRVGAAAGGKRRSGRLTPARRPSSRSSRGSGGFDDDEEEEDEEEEVTYFKVVVVSERFAGLSLREQLLLCYNSVIDDVWDPPSHDFVPDLEPQWLKYSIVGKNVASLPQFRYSEFKVIFQPKTPGFWSKLQLDGNLSLKQFKAFYANPPKVWTPPVKISNKIPALRDAETSLPGGKADSTAGSVKSGTSRSTTKKKKPKKKKKDIAAGLAALYETGPVETTPPDQVYKQRSKEYRLAAKKIQKVFRANRLYPLIRMQLRQHRAATTLSNVWRAYVAKKFAKHVRAILSRFALIPQRLWWGYKARLQYKQLRLRKITAVIKIQKICRGWKGRRWWHFVHNYRRTCITIQRVARGYLARKQAALMRRRKYEREVMEPAAVKMQSVWRLHAAKAIVQKRREEVYHNTVVIPAAIKMSTIFRVRKAVKVKLQKRAEREGAIQLQKIVRGAKPRPEFRERLQKAREDKAATKFQTAWRGCVARRLLVYRKDKWYLENKIIPAAQVIQRWKKGASVRMVVKNLKKEREAAARIQRAWRGTIARRESLKVWRELFKARKNKLATVLQSVYRGWAARRYAKFVKYEKEGLEIRTARQLQRWWRMVQAKLIMDDALELHRLEVTRKRLEQWRDDAVAIDEDVSDVLADIKNRLKVKKRVIKQIRQLRIEREESERRIPQVEEEMTKLTEEDVQRGWAEALEREWEWQTNFLGMCKEEVRDKKLQVRELDSTVEGLRLELDDLDVDMDMTLTREVEEIETMRKLEIDMCERRRHRVVQLAIRRQRVRWGVEDYRRNVVRRKRLEEEEAKLPKPSDKLPAPPGWDVRPTIPRVTAAIGALLPNQLMPGGGGIIHKGMVTTHDAPDAPKAGDEIEVAYGKRAPEASIHPVEMLPLAERRRYQASPLKLQATTVSTKTKVELQKEKQRMRQRLLDARAAAREQERLTAGGAKNVMSAGFDSVVTSTEAVLKDASWDIRHPKGDPRQFPSAY